MGWDCCYTGNRLQETHPNQGLREHPIGRQAVRFPCVQPPPLVGWKPPLNPFEVLPLFGGENHWKSSVITFAAVLTIPGRVYVMCCGWSRSYPIVIICSECSRSRYRDSCVTVFGSSTQKIGVFLCGAFNGFGECFVRHFLPPLMTYFFFLVFFVGTIYIPCGASTS